MRLPAVLIVLLLSAASARAQSFDADVKPLLATYCNECHKPGKTRGDLDLAHFTNADLAARSPQVWEGVVERVRNGEMPPAKSKQLSQAEKDRLYKGIKSLAALQLDCSKFANDETQQWFKGHVMSRRLNRAEYRNSIRDLLGIDLPDIADDLPADGAGGEGFDTVGDALFTSPIHIEKYVDAAETALEALLGDTKPAAERLGKETVKAARDRVLVAKPEKNVAPREAAKRVVESFARRAFRRPVEPAEVERYLKLFDRAAGRGDTFEHSIKYALQGVLISPNFLFLIEPEPAQPGNYPLGDYPLASRLSYFLWASMPDDELFKLAAEMKLQDPEVLRQQTRRMLKDPKSAGLAERFALQWLNLDAVGGTSRPDAQRYPQFNDRVATAMKREAVLLVDRVFREDRPLVELLTADYTFLNEELAKLYGVKDVKGADMRLVQLSDRNRGGILGLGAVHVATSYPLRTSPVLRGKWVAADLLGLRVPPPPPDAGELPHDDRHANKLSFRQQLELHRKNPECASCHNRIDPLGFGLENFDAIGRWRSTDGTGQPIDSSGQLTSGETFAGPAELRDVLLKKRGEFEQNLVKKMLGYALGRDLKAGGRRPGQFDQCVIDDCLAAMKQTEGRSTAIFETIVLSKPFRHRYKPKT